MGNMIISGDGLSRRKKQILRSVIEAHIALGEPVGSKYLMTAADIPFSSATIRNEMAELEAMGYLEQPHTSSGRVPTKLGYRFYVDSLMENYKLTASEIITLNNMLKSRIGELDSILQSATKLVASLTNYPTVALKTKSAANVATDFSYMLLGENEFLLVMRLSDSSVKTVHLKTDLQLSDAILSQLCNILNIHATNVDPQSINLSAMMKMERAMGDASSLVGVSVKALYEATATEKTSDIRFEGVNKLLEYPEFASVDKMRRILQMMEDKDDLINIISEGDEDKVNVVIGEEDNDIVNDSAFIYRKLIVDGKVVGAIGVFGPSRMDYSKVVSTVEYLSERISGIFKAELPPPPRSDDDDV
ncbi:MAG: heat-inducible transcriptional repressor HrcA [Clostridia bacterium]|nr:heat-inducible transcriptional repressor HrcA [Clostridia bacterium]